MTNGEIKGIGNSWFIRGVPDFLERYPTYEAMAQAWRDGTLTMDLAGQNPDGWNRLGTPLNDETLLKNSTAALYGKGADAVPDEILAQISADLGNISTDLSKKANIQKPTRIEFPFTDGFKAYQDCSYNIDQFGVVQILIGSAETTKELTAWEGYIIGLMPEGLRSRGQIYGLGGVGSLNLMQVFTNSNGVVQIRPTAQVQVGHKFYFQLTYPAYF